MEQTEEIYKKIKEIDSEKIRDILKDIDNIFHSKNFVYKSQVEIVTKDGVSEETLVGKTGTSLLTMDGKAIPISEIRKNKKI